MMMMRHMWWLAVAGLACGAAAIAVGTAGADAAHSRRLVVAEFISIEGL